MNQMMIEAVLVFNKLAFSRAINLLSKEEQAFWAEGEEIEKFPESLKKYTEALKK